jgi:ribosome-associated heat shock protein Hsp15
VGDELRITRAAGRRQQVIVKSLSAQHIPKSEARLLYEDVTPPPTPEELAVRELERHFWTSRVRASTRTPDRREKRRIRREKEGEDEGPGTRG